MKLLKEDSEDFFKKQELNLRASNIGKIIQGYKIINEETFDALIMEYYEKNIFELKDEIVLIYRGIRISDPEANFMFYDSSKFLSRLPEVGVPPIIEYVMSSGMSGWSNFPPRHKSLVCSFSKEVASRFTYSEDDLYVVIPLARQYVGIAPAEDIVHSFEIGLSEAGFDDVNEFYDVVVEFMSKMLNMPKSAIHRDFFVVSSLTSWSQADFQTINKHFDEIDFKYFGPFLYSEDEYNDEKLKKIPDDKIKIMEEFRAKYPEFFKICKKYGGLLHGIDEILRPEKNGFVRLKYEDLKAHGFENDDKECWLAGLSVLVRYKKFMKLISGSMV